ncbi:MAG: hypothetical protein DHS80DRAFT_17859 [Piptocephalis tieghemiana]|nr:MAG: hypothetical protein DHS80DRAFT_17859 [Piptocephalis tieghemiana]
MNRPRSRTGSRGTSGELRTPPSNIQVPPPVSQGGANRSATSFYQITINIIDRLSCIPSCQEYLEPDYLSRLTGSEIASMDPVTTLWNIFRLGNLLCELANISQAPAGQPLKIEPGNNLTNLNMCKRSIYSFLVFCKRIQIPEKDTFSITELFKNDTNGFVHVLRTVSLVLDYLQDRGLIDTSNPQPHRFSAASTIFGDPSSPPTDNRAKCVHELLQTERVYIQDLEKLQSHNATLSSKGTLPPFTLVNIFANINALLDFQRKFLIGIEASASQIPEQQLFGGMFVQMEQGFSVYETFCSNYKNASHIVVEEQKKLSEIPSVVDPGSGLGSLLIKPVQRICKYPLLLQEILKLTDPTWPTYTDLQEGIAAIKRVNDRVNSALARVENQAKARELVHRVKDWKEYSVASFGDLLLSSKFVMSTSDSEREMWVYLFERILICCKEIPQKKAKKSKDGTDGTPSQLQLKGRIYMTSVTNVKNISRENKFMLKVLWRDAETGSFVLKCQNEEQLKQWQTLMEKLIHANDADDALRRTSGRSPQPPSSSSSLGRPPLSTAMSAHGNPSAGPTLGQDPSGFEGPGGGGSTGYVGQGMSPAEQAAVNGGGGSRPSFRSSGVGPTGSVKLKVNYQDDVYIIPVVNNISFEELITKLDRKIRLCGGTPPSSAEGFRIRYHDEDGDFVTIKNDEDVATSFEGRDLSNSATILNIFVS